MDRSKDILKQRKETLKSLKQTLRNIVYEQVGLERDPLREDFNKLYKTIRSKMRDFLNKNPITIE